MATIISAMMLGINESCSEHNSLSKTGVSNLRPAGHLRPPEQTFAALTRNENIVLVWPQEQWSSLGSFTQLIPLNLAWDTLRHTSPIHSITAIKHQLAIHNNKDI